MKLQIFSAAFVVASALAFLGAAWSAEEPAVKPIPAHHEGLTRAPDDPVVEAEDLVQTQRLADFVLDAMLEWPQATIPVADYGRVAEDIARAAISDPLWKEDPTWRVPRKAMLLAALAYYEGARFAAYVDDGRCNDSTWRISPEGQRLLRYGGCDDGIAVSLWQVHPTTFQDEDGKFVSFTKEFLLDRRNAAGAALVIARRSLMNTGTLRWYTGEWTGDAPKARERLKFAEKAYDDHPYEW